MTPEDDVPACEDTAEDKSPEPVTLDVQSSRHVPKDTRRSRLRRRLADRRARVALAAGLAVGGPAVLGGCGMLDLNEYGAQHRAAVTWQVAPGVRHTGPASSDPTRQSSGYDGCVSILDYYAPRYLAEAACHVNRDWREGEFGWVILENGTYVAP